MTFRERLAGAGPALIATFVLVPRIEVIELLAYAGFDVAILDLEHGPYSVEALAPLIAASRSAGISCLVRVAEDRAQQIGAVLDVGADGAIVPNVQSEASAASIVAAARFAPDGKRGANPYVRAARYSANESYLTAANEAAAIIGMVEGKEGLSAVDSILGVEGLDAILLGPVDMSMALGVPGQPEHPTVIASMSRIVEKASARGVATGVFAPNTNAAARWLKLGVRLVALSVDTALMLDGFRSAVNALHALIDQETDSSDS
jgi:2-keto-3-deoxy-L-rhamnonate aldolase RhmA